MMMLFGDLSVKIAASYLRPKCRIAVHHHCSQSQSRKSLWSFFQLRWVSEEQQKTEIVLQYQAFCLWKNQFMWVYTTKVTNKENYKLNREPGNWHFCVWDELIWYKHTETVTPHFLQAYGFLLLSYHGDIFKWDTKYSDIRGQTTKHSILEGKE